MRDTIRFGGIALLMLRMATGVSFGQELKPGVFWAEEGSASWTTDSNWELGEAGGVPGEGQVASIKNGGTANVTSAAPATDALSIGNGGVEVGAGGSLDISEAIVIGGSGILSLSGDGSAKAASLANLGTLSLSGASSVDLSGGFSNVGLLSLDGGTISAAGTATLTGSSIDVSTTPAMGVPIPFLTSSGVVGQPASITVGGVAPALDRGLGLHVAVDGGAASVALGSIPIVVVNRDTGEVVVENAAGNAMDIKGYELLSGNGLLSADDWNSLTAQGASGWSTIPSSNGNVLTELNVAESSTLNVGDTVSLGNAWTGTTVSPREEDVEINVLLSDGRTLAGAVEYVGAANDLVLNIDPETGVGTLQHMSASLGDLEVVRYSIFSDSGALNTAGFTGTIGEGFGKPNPQPTALSEISPETSVVFSNGTAFDLGAIYTLGAAQDITFEFGVAGNEQSLPGTVQFGSGILPTLCDPNTGGDLDGGGDVVFADFLVFSTNFGQTAADHTEGDIDCDGMVAFSDFLVLSTNFGSVVLPPTCDPNTGGDLDGSGDVAFADFLILSTNFGQTAADHTEGDIDCDGMVAFSDFLVLSTNFGRGVGAETASVPEPSAGLMILLGTLGMFTLRKHRVHAAAIVAVAGLVMAATPSETHAQQLQTRFVRIHPEGPNHQIDSATEALGILEGNVLDVIVNEDIVENVLTADFGGGAGSYANDQNSWGNGVDDDAMDDFIQYIAGVWEIPEGEYTVGFGSDDGGMLRFTNPALTFDETFNENGPEVAGRGTLLFNGTRGHNWTSGHLTVPEGGVTTGIEGFAFERSGGDSFEIAYVIDKLYDAGTDGDLNDFMATGFELDNGDFGSWKLTNDPFVPGSADPSDLNSDGRVDFTDFTIMSDNWGNPYGFNEFFALTESFSGAAGEASSVPEPTSIMLLVSAFAMLFSVRQRRRR